jgi:hypothetical protein
MFESQKQRKEMWKRNKFRIAPFYRHVIFFQTLYEQAVILRNLTEK